jgi:hypothetical protein
VDVVIVPGGFASLKLDFVKSFQAEPVFKER